MTRVPAYPPGAVLVPHTGRAVMELTQFVWNSHAYGLVPRGTIFVPVLGSAVAFQRNEGVRNAAAAFAARRRQAEAAAEGRNAAIRDALAGAPDLGWVLFVDTDEDVPPDAIVRLLDAGRSVASATVLQRYPPFDVTAFWSVDPPRRVGRSEVPVEGGVEVAACGTGCLLVRREVLDAVGDPWFRCGQIDPELIQEDLDFTIRAAALGHRPWLDGTLRVRHEIRHAWVVLGADGRPWVRMFSQGHGEVTFPVDIPREVPR